MIGVVIPGNALGINTVGTGGLVDAVGVEHSAVVGLSVLGADPEGVIS